MAAKTKIDVVVFDLGGVLVRIARGWDDAHRLAGLADDHPMLTSEEFHPRGAAAAHAYQTGTMDFDEWAQAMVEASEGAYSAEDAKRVMEAWTIEEYAGIREVIDAIHDAGLATAALSNTNQRHWELLGAHDESYTDYPNLGAIQQLHASHILGEAKPDPAIFDAFTEAAGLGKARVLFFEDTKPNVDAARRYGWAARHIDYAGDPAAQMMGALRHHRILD
jgi:FMN phosphatase YigB (HAD superfamily)